MAEVISLSEPHYLVLFQPSMGQTPYRLTVSILDGLWQYRNGKFTLPLGLDRGLVPALPCLWYCLQLPRTRFDLVHVPIKARKFAQRLYLPQRIVLLPVPWPSDIVPGLNNGCPKLIFTPDDLLDAAQELAREIDHVIDITPVSALDVTSLQRHWMALHVALALDRPQHIQPSRLLDLYRSSAALISTHFMARHLRADADDYLPTEVMSQPEILGYSLDFQAQLSAIARLEALHTPPREAEAIFPTVLEEEAKRFQCPVSVGVPGVSPKVAQRVIQKALPRSGIISGRGDADIEGWALGFAVAHRALSRGGIGFVSRPIEDEAFALLDALESMWAQGGPRPRAVWRYLERIGHVVRRSFAEVELAVLSHASSLTSFSEFPIGLMTLPYDSSPLGCRVPITYRPLVPFTRAVQFELTPVPIIYLKEQLRVLVAECMPVDDPIGRLSRVGWEAATRILFTVPNVTFRVQQIGSIVDFRSALREADYDILVISAHGVVDSTQNRTGFVCGKDLVVEEELSPLPMVVCFSACQVSPRGRGTVNITDLMFRQGAIVIIGTMVPVDVRRMQC